MGTREKCRYCDELAVAYQLEADASKTPICAYHIPVSDNQKLPQLRDSVAAAEDKNQTGN